MEFRILGPVEVWDGDRRLDVGAPKPRALLAVMLLHANQALSCDGLIDWLWGETSPPTARNLVQVYVSRLRQALHHDGCAPRLVTSPPGYLLRLEPGELDLHRFEALTAQAKQDMHGGSFEAAAERLRAALALWRGPALSDVASETLRRTVVPRLEDVRLAAVEERVDIDLHLGGHAGLVGELRALVAAHPDRERLRGQLMLALYRSGRRAEALAVYRTTRRVLVEELGIEPSPALQELERAILRSDPALEPARVAAGGAAWQPALVPGPCQLPPDIDDFTGRAVELATVRRLLGVEQVDAMVISAIAGKAGVGKTALAVRAAHQLRPCFPDGQLFVNLQGAEAQPLDQAEVLAGFLRALGIKGSAIAERLEERVRQYRSEVADRRVLVVLDNAADEAQVRPLLPGGPGCAALVTSRTRLTGLEAAHPLILDVLDADQGVALLAKLAGPQRVAAEPAMARTIVELCGRLPLAVRIAGAKLAAKPHWRLARLADRLGNERRRLDELKAGDLEVRASVALSYHGRGEDERWLFRLLGLLEAPDFAAWTAAALLDAPLAVAEDLLERLVEAQLVEAAGEDAVGQTRYRFHDLLRVFAAERAHQQEPAAARLAAVRRLLTAALTLAARADARLEFGGLCVPGDALRGHRWTAPGLLLRLIDERPADWLAAEQAALSAAVAQAHQAGLWELSWLLAGSLAGLFEIRASWDAWRQTHLVALAAARRGGDRNGEAAMLRSLGTLSRDQCSWDQAIASLQESLRLFRELGDRRGEAAALLSLGNVHRGQGRLDDAQACLTQSLRLFHALGDRRWEAASLQSLGIVHFNQGHDEHACTYLDQALERFRHLGDRLWQAYTLRELGQLHCRFGRPDAALACLRECLPIFRATGDRLWEAHTLLSMAEAYRELQQWEEATGCLEGCLPLLGQLGDRRGQAIATRSLGHVHRELGRFDQATASYQQARSLFRELGNRIGDSYTLQGLGELHQAQGRLRDAIACYEQALPALREAGFRHDEAEALGRLAELRADGGDYAGARQALQAEEAIRQQAAAAASGDG